VVDERGVPRRHGRTSGDESESRMSIRYCGERLSHAKPGKKEGDPRLAEEVVPGDNIGNVGPLRDVWCIGMGLFVDTTADDKMFRSRT